MEYCYGFRNLCSWKDSEFHITLSRERERETGVFELFWAENMRNTDRRHMATDSIAWIAEGPLSHEYGGYLKWLTESLRYSFGLLNQNEEDEFHDVCMRMERSRWE